MDAISAPTTYPATELFQRRQPCISLLVAAEAEGFKLGDKVQFNFGAETKPLTGRIATFQCDWQGKPAAWIDVDGYAPTWRHLAPVADLKNLTKQVQGYIETYVQKQGGK